MNGLEMLYHMLFVEPELSLWGLITIGVIFAMISIILDYGFDSTDAHK